MNAQKPTVLLLIQKFSKKAIQIGTRCALQTWLAMLGCCMVSCKSSVDLRTARLPESRGFHEEPLRFERWSYLYTDEDSHYLRYRWHVGSRIWSRDLRVSRAECPLGSVSQVYKADFQREVALRPQTKNGAWVGFVRREAPRDLWITTRGRMQVSPIASDMIDSLIEEADMQSREQSDPDTDGRFTASSGSK